MHDCTLGCSTKCNCLSTHPSLGNLDPSQHSTVQQSSRRTSAVFVESKTPVMPGAYTPESSAHAPVMVISFVFTLCRSCALPQPLFSTEKSHTPMRLQAEAVMTRGFGLEGSEPGAKQMEWMVSLWKAARVAEGARMPSLLRGAVCEACVGSNTYRLPFSSPVCSHSLRCMHSCASHHYRGHMDRFQNVCGIRRLTWVHGETMYADPDGQMMETVLDDEVQHLYTTRYEYSCKLQTRLITSQSEQLWSTCNGREQALWCDSSTFLKKTVRIHVFEQN